MLPPPSPCPQAAPHQGPELCRELPTPTLNPTLTLDMCKTELVLFSKTLFCPIPSFPTSVDDTTIQPRAEPSNLDRIPHSHLALCTHTQSTLRSYRF